MTNELFIAGLKFHIATNPYLRFEQIIQNIIVERYSPDVQYPLACFPCVAQTERQKNNINLYNILIEFTKSKDYLAFINWIDEDKDYFFEEPWTTINRWEQKLRTGNNEFS